MFGRSNVSKAFSRRRGVGLLASLIEASPVGARQARRAAREEPVGISGTPEAAKAATGLCTALCCVQPGYPRADAGSALSLVLRRPVPLDRASPSAA
jgi:hypothetical protein